MKDKAEIEATKSKARDVRTTPDSRRTPNKGAKGAPRAMMGVESKARPSRVGRRDGPRAQAMHETSTYADGNVGGDVLPIPVVVVEAVPLHDLSRGIRQRVHRRKK